MSSDYYEDYEEYDYDSSAEAINTKEPTTEVSEFHEDSEEYDHDSSMDGSDV